MTFADLQAAVGQAVRRYGYVRDNVIRILTPGGGARQQGYSVELAGAMLFEADEFFDRALMLFLLRAHLRAEQAATWATVATYYSNYFSATAFMRLHLYSVTHLVGGAAYDIVPTSLFHFRAARSGRLTHRDLWMRYYQLVTEMAWPGPAEVGTLAPAVAALRFKEQGLRERVNYRAGDGFQEIHLSEARYADQIQDVRRLDRTLPVAGLTDDAYNDRLAAERLLHVGRLFRRLEPLRKDPDIEVQRWRQREALVERYSAGIAERRFGHEVLAR